MTYDKFLQELTDLSISWHLEKGKIRCSNGDCPITAISREHGQSFVLNYAYEASEYLGLHYLDTENIIKGADFAKSPKRHDIMKACGLGQSWLWF